MPCALDIQDLHKEVKFVAISTSNFLSIFPTMLILCFKLNPSYLFYLPPETIIIRGRKTKKYKYLTVSKHISRLRAFLYTIHVTPMLILPQNSSTILFQRKHKMTVSTPTFVSESSAWYVNVSPVGKFIILKASLNPGTTAQNYK